MSLLTIIGKQLMMAKNLAVAGNRERRNVGSWGQMVDFFVAPKPGIYAVEELQEFMMSLSLPPAAAREDVSDEGDVVSFGKLWFVEEIERGGTSPFELEIVPAPGNASPQRCITVWVYPNERIAAAFSRDEELQEVNWLSKEEMEKQQAREWRAR